MGPVRVIPSRLSVSRSFGDAEAKLERLGGKPGVIISTPEIKSFNITPAHDFLIIGSDGVFDKMSNREVVNTVFDHLSKGEDIGESVHLECGKAVELIIKTSLVKKTLDNVSIIMIVFKGYKSAYQRRIKEIKEEPMIGDSEAFSALQAKNASITSE